MQINADWEGTIFEKDGVTYMRVDTGLIRITPYPKNPASPADVELDRGDLVVTRGDPHSAKRIYLGRDRHGDPRACCLDICAASHYLHDHPHTGNYEVIGHVPWFRGDYIGVGSRDIHQESVRKLGWTAWSKLSFQDQKDMLRAGLAAKEGALEAC